VVYRGPEEVITVKVKVKVMVTVTAMVTVVDLMETQLVVSTKKL